MNLVLAINMENLMFLLFLFVHIFIFFFSPYVVDSELQVYYFHSFLQEFQYCIVQYHREIFVGNRTLG